MSTGATIAIVAGVVAVGGLAFIVLRKPTITTGAAKPKVPANASAGSLIASLGGSLVSRLGNDAITSLEGSFSDWLS